MKHVHFDEADQITGFYADDDPNLPEPTIEITDDQWRLCIPNPKAWRVDRTVGTVVQQALPQPTGADLIRQGVYEVRQKTLAFRAQVAEYADQYKLAGWNDKARRAERVLSGDASAADISVVQCEAARRAKGETAEDLAQKQVDKAVRLGTAVSVIDGLEDAALERLPDSVLADTVPELLAGLERDIAAHLADVWETS